MENAVPPTTSPGSDPAAIEDRAGDSAPIAKLGELELDLPSPESAAPSRPEPTPPSAGVTSARTVPSTRSTPRPAGVKTTPTPPFAGASLGKPILSPPLSNRRREAESPPAAPRSTGPGPLGRRSPAGPIVETAPEPPGLTRGGVHLSPRMTAIFGGLFGLATVTSVIALLIQVVPPRNERAIVSGSAAPSGSATAPPKASAESKRPKRVAIPGPWRVSELEKDPSMEVLSGTMDKKSLLEALGDKGVPKAQVYRIMKAFDGTRKFDKSGRKERYTVALARATKRVSAFEYEVSASEIYQSREGADGLLSPGARLDMKIAEGEVQGAFYMGGDLAAAVRDGGFEDGLVPAMDEALSGRISTESFEEGGTVRVIAVEETALGLFSRYKRLVALEYRPPDPAAKPVRIYTFNGTEARGYWDEHGKQPYAGGWRSPVPGAPVTSRFNPKRMHPVLHKIMPHQGTDLGAPMGTPIYSAYRGVIESVGPLGPCGNAVEIQHPGGILTGYCHMSRFGTEKAGDHVGTHHLIGYVGATGRATGPHLHFFAKKNGVFFDAETLQLDGERVVPTSDRQAFLATKAELDRRLEAIPLPEPPPEAAKPAPAASGSAAAGSPEPAGSTEAPDPVGKQPSGGRRAVVVGSPAALASAAAEPGIHPKGFVEDTGEDDDDSPAPAPGSSAAPPPKGKGAPDPAEGEDDEH